MGILDHSQVTIEEGKRTLINLVKSYEEKKADWNEAETRFHYLDELLVKCFGWHREKVEVENYEDRSFADYILNNKLVVEAKRESDYFEIPAETVKNLIFGIPSLITLSKNLGEALSQAQHYASARGIEFAAVCNGNQLVAFQAIAIGKPPLQGKALVFKDFGSLVANFGIAWQCLSPDGIFERKLERKLKARESYSTPPKPSSKLKFYPQYRYKNKVQETLRDIGELLIEEIVETEELQKDFFRECYCNTSALSRHALVSKKILETRYSALFSPTEKASKTVPVSADQDKIETTREILTEAAAKRPIVLLGDAGVGKTTFIKRLILSDAEKEFKNSIYIYIDLGSQATFEKSLKEFVIREIANQLDKKYNVDVNADNFVKGVYNLDVKKFEKSFKGRVSKGNPKKAKEARDNFILEKLESRSSHLKRSLEHLQKARRQPIIIILDNADQRPASLQQEAFVMAQEFAGKWSALTFISLRPKTFYRSKKDGVLSAYPQKVFTIVPPRPEIVIERRLIFALNVAEGKLSPEVLKGVKLYLGNMVLFLKSLIFSIQVNDDIKEFLANITGGNIRSVIELVGKFIGNPNVDFEKIIEIMDREAPKKYLIPVHEFSKAAILGDFSHYNKESSLAFNLFDVVTRDEKEHFLAPLILGYLMWENAPQDNDGFVLTEKLEREIMGIGFTENQINLCLERLLSKNLIEPTERAAFELEETYEKPHALRPTTVGVYHINRWMGTFGYIDAMLFDTPIFDETTFEKLTGEIEDFHIKTRYERSSLFKNYLNEIWSRSKFKSPFFDWFKAQVFGKNSFEAVRRAVRRH